MRSVVLISPHFPPSTLAGVHRARHMAKHLPAFVVGHMQRPREVWPLRASRIGTMAEGTPGCIQRPTPLDRRRVCRRRRAETVPIATPAALLRRLRLHHDRREEDENQNRRSDTHQNVNRAANCICRAIELPTLEMTPNVGVPS